MGCLSPVRIMVATSGGARAPKAPPQFRYNICRALDVGKFRESVGTDIEVRQPGFYQSGDLRGVPADAGGTPCIPDGFSYGPGARGGALVPPWACPGWGLAGARGRGAVSRNVAARDGRAVLRRGVVGGESGVGVSRPFPPESCLPREDKPLPSGGVRLYRWDCRALKG